MSKETKLSQEQEIYLKDYALRFGSNLALSMRKLMEAKLESQEREIMESAPSPQILQHDVDMYLKVPSDVDYKTLRTFMNKLIEILYEVRKLADYHGIQISLIKIPDGDVVFYRESEIVVNEGDERILESEIDSMPDSDKIVEDENQNHE